MECRVRGIPVHYEVRGEGRPLLLLHGMPSDHRHMVEDFEPLFAKRGGWKRIYPDLPGMGRTPGADWITRQDHMLEVVLELIDQLIGGERFALVGASYGGHLARGVVHRRASSLDGVALLVPRIANDPAKATLPPRTVLVEDAAVRAQLRPEEQPALRVWVVQSERHLEHFRSSLLPAFAAAQRPFLEKLDDSFSFDVDALPEPFPKPSIFLMGRQDALTGYHDAWSILENYPRATFAVLDRAGHSLRLDQEAAFEALMHDWLDRVEEAAGPRPA